MREHMGLYRGKRKDNGKWVEGWYCKVAFGRWPLRDAIIPNEEAEAGNYHPYEVDPDTVGEYTGLPDKNGKLIFEGDILHVVSECCDYDYKTDVGRKFGYISGLYVDGDFNGGDFTEIGFAVDYWSEDDADVEIIGNIHDNPELLKSEG